MLRIPRFRGIFMRDRLPKRIRSNECGIINLDEDRGAGTHWVGYVKKNKHIMYFDSIGHLKPPPEVIAYFRSDGSPKINYNFTRYQELNTYNCGHLVLEFLHKYSRQSS